MKPVTKKLLNLNSYTFSVFELTLLLPTRNNIYLLFIGLLKIFYCQMRADFNFIVVHITANISTDPNPALWDDVTKMGIESITIQNKQQHQCNSQLTSHLLVLTKMLI